MIEDPRALAARLIAASPLAMSLEEALRQKRERRAALLASPSCPAKPEPDFMQPEKSPLPIVDAPETFAADFWHKRAKPLGDPPPPPKRKSTKPRGRKPAGDLPAGASRFRIIDGDRDGDGDKQK